MEEEKDDRKRCRSRVVNPPSARQLEKDRIPQYTGECNEAYYELTEQEESELEELRLTDHDFFFWVLLRHVGRRRVGSKVQRRQGLLPEPDADQQQELRTPQESMKATDRKLLFNSLELGGDPEASGFLRQLNLRYNERVGLAIYSDIHLY